MDDLIARFRDAHPRLPHIDQRKTRICPPEEIDAFEAQTGLTIPADLRTLFTTSDIGIIDGAGFLTHNFRGALYHRDELRKQARKIPADLFEFNPGVEEGRIHGTWFHEGWLPFAKDECGNLRIVSLTPPPNGTVGQVITLVVENQRGPFFHTTSFDAWIRQAWASMEARGLASPPEPVDAPASARLALIAAIESDDVAAAEAALAEGFDPAWRDASGAPLLSAAATQEATEVAIAIARACPAACGRQDPGVGYYPIHHAKDARLVAALLEGGADPRVVMAKGRTAMHAAASDGDLERIRLLAAAGADLHTTYKMSPATMATWVGQEDAALLLMELGGHRGDEAMRDHATRKGLGRVLAAMV